MTTSYRGVATVAQKPPYLTCGMTMIYAKRALLDRRLSATNGALPALRREKFVVFAKRNTGSPPPSVICKFFWMSKAPGFGVSPLLLGIFPVPLTLAIGEFLSVLGLPSFSVFGPAGAAKMPPIPVGSERKLIDRLRLSASSALLSIASRLRIRGVGAWAIGRTIGAQCRSARMGTLGW